MVKRSVVRSRAITTRALWSKKLIWARKERSAWRLYPQEKQQLHAHAPAARERRWSIRTSGADTSKESRATWFSLTPMTDGMAEWGSWFTTQRPRRKSMRTLRWAH